MNCIPAVLHVTKGHRMGHILVWPQFKLTSALLESQASRHQLSGPLPRVFYQAISTIHPHDLMNIEAHLVS